MSDTLHNNINTQPTPNVNLQRAELVAEGAVMLGTLGELAANPNIPILGRIGLGALVIALGLRGKHVLTGMIEETTAEGSNGSASKPTVDK